MQENSDTNGEIAKLEKRIVELRDKNANEINATKEPVEDQVQYVARHKPTPLWNDSTYIWR